MYCFVFYCIVLYLSFFFFILEYICFFQFFPFVKAHTSHFLLPKLDFVFSTTVKPFFKFIIHDPILSCDKDNIFFLLCLNDSSTSDTLDYYFNNLKVFLYLLSSMYFLLFFQQEFCRFHKNFLFCIFFFHIWYLPGFCFWLFFLLSILLNLKHNLIKFYSESSPDLHHFHLIPLISLFVYCFYFFFYIDHTIFG